MKTESFFKGTLILIVANTISKILGAVLKIPLTYILGEQGMAIYQTAFSVYVMLLSLITSGIPFALSKYIAESVPLKKYGNIRFALTFTTALMCLLGLAASFIMFLGADFFAFSMKDPKASLAIRAIAPSIFFVALGAVYKSLYQGYSHQTPTAISQVIEAFIKLIAGYGLASWFSAFSIRYASAASVFGVTVGEAAATLILFLLYFPYKRENAAFSPESRRRDIARAIAGIALPMTAVSVVSGSLGLLETSVIRNRLTSIVFTEKSALEFLSLYSSYTDVFGSLPKTLHLSFDGARWLYGAYSGYAATVFNLPAGILATFGVSILPIVTRCITLGDSSHLRTSISSTAKIILTISAPCAAIMMLFSRQILDILFSNTASSLMLSCLAPLLVIVTLTQFVYSVHHAAGDIMTPFFYSLIALAVRILLSYILIGIPELNILGAIISSLVSAVIQLVLNIRLLVKKHAILPVAAKDVFKAIACTTLMSIVSLLITEPLCTIFKNNFLGFAVSVLVALLTYTMAVFLSGLITKEEIARAKR